MDTEPDERIKVIIENFQQQFQISYETISIYAGISEDSINNFVIDSNSISLEEKYKLAITALFLHHICNKD